MSLPAKIAAFYTTPAHMTDPCELDRLLKDAPTDIPGMVAYIQNLIVHVHWASAYRLHLTPQRQDETHTRSTHDMLALMREHDPRPLPFVRTLAQRMVGNCRHFSTFGTALFRRAGIPARARCGFGMYFENGKGVDHWVIEYWNGSAWQLLDAQIDAMQHTILRLAFDTLDVPRDQFRIAYDAWQLTRAGKADPESFGIFDMKGYWFIAGNLLRDFASLNNMEMLPWDVWGRMPEVGKPMSEDGFALFDKLAELTADPDAHFADLRRLYADDGLRVPAQVFNDLRRQLETV